jgi:hypothetical protein
MSCDICGRGACANWMHSEDQQRRYEKVIDAFDRARQLREEVREAETEVYRG